MPLIPEALFAILLVPKSVLFIPPFSQDLTLKHYTPVLRTPAQLY
jgi:hypothetical protein